MWEKKTIENSEIKSIPSDINGIYMGEHDFEGVLKKILSLHEPLIQVHERKTFSFPLKILMKYAHFSKYHKKPRN